jgi:hypothetical protein
VEKLAEYMHACSTFVLAFYNNPCDHFKTCVVPYMYIYIKICAFVKKIRCSISVSLRAVPMVEPLIVSMP